MFRRNTQVENIPNTFPELYTSFVNVKKLVGYGFYNRTWARLDLRAITTIALSSLQNIVVKEFLIFRDIPAVPDRTFDIWATINSVVFLCDDVLVYEGTGTKWGPNCRISAIYVKDDLVSMYKSATGWSAKAAIFKPLSECPYDLPQLS